MDFLTFSGHKLYAPKGIGGWYARPGVSLPPLVHGGHQERGMRSGTENVAGIAALGKACDMARGDMAPEAERQQQLRHRLEQGISATIPEVRIQGANRSTSPQHVEYCLCPCRRGDPVDEPGSARCRYLYGVGV